MLIHPLILFIVFHAVIYAENCSCCMVEESFNESIVSYHITMLDISLAASQPHLYQYSLETSTCPDNISINVEYKIFTPEIGINTFETYFSGSINLETAQNYFTNNEVLSGLIPTVSGNEKLKTLISYISQSGRLPNGKYLFSFTLLDNDSNISLNTALKIVDIQIPLTLDLLSPGGSLSELNSTYTHSTLPLFNWYSDSCPNCEFSIRICEYNQDHESLEDALSSRSLVPLEQSDQFLSIGWNTNIYQYPSVGHIDLELGKYYVWQIRRSFDTTIGKQHNYSPINVFEVRPPDKTQLDYSDPYLSLIESIIGEEKFYLLFSPGGELERFTTTGDIIWVNDEEIHIDGLYSILSDLKNNNISIRDVSIE